MSQTQQATPTVFARARHTREFRSRLVCPAPRNPFVCCANTDSPPRRKHSCPACGKQLCSPHTFPAHRQSSPMKLPLRQSIRMTLYAPAAACDAILHTAAIAAARFHAQCNSTPSALSQDPPPHTHTHRLHTRGSSTPPHTTQTDQAFLAYGSCRARNARRDEDSSCAKMHVGAQRLHVSSCSAYATMPRPLAPLLATVASSADT